MTARLLQKRPGLYTVQVTHAGGKRLTWMHMCASISEALAWARRRWPDATGFAAQALRARRPLGVISSPRPRRALARTGGGSG